MKAALGKSWRDAASLIVLANRNAEAALQRASQNSNYDILLQTRPHTASFSNSIVFPGGVTEEADADESWLRLISSFGFTQEDFASLHKPGTNISIFASNPIKRHVSLRITAIRETFEELGLLICSTKHKNNRGDTWANVIHCDDVQYWQDRIGKNPLDLLNLCKEHNCYPDIWSLHFWSAWLTPSFLPKRFDTAFFITAVQSDVKLPKNFQKQEVVKVEWANPKDILQRSNKGEIDLFPPQGYEFYRLSHCSDLEDLIRFAKQRVCDDNDFVYNTRVRAKDGVISLFPGDDLFPDVNYINDEPVRIEKTVLELREAAHTLHRVEHIDATDEKTLVLKNYKPNNHINMGDVILPFNVKL
ncbi:nucleoside diphosphate-linked moiety X motif 19-like [Aricia agestis]|uniref:nucleoside diphosphate-linked moiety X motif 19-like n=1 Tax=Aricia agestis TaxID=91739 RepID=UPI001C208061|nr:nucleoside diphosphate-linked moiety X motif 19-like [Aricia agestis]